MTADATIARLAVGMVWAAKVIPLGCCGNYAKAVRDLDEVEPLLSPNLLYRIETFE